MGRLCSAEGLIAGFPGFKADFQSHFGNLTTSFLKNGETKAICMSIRERSRSAYEPGTLIIFAWPLNSFGQSVLTAEVKILPYRPSPRLIRTESSPLVVKVEKKVSL